MIIRPLLLQRAISPSFEAGTPTLAQEMGSVSESITRPSSIVCISSIKAWNLGSSKAQVWRRPKGAGEVC